MASTANENVCASLTERLAVLVGAVLQDKIIEEGSGKQVERTHDIEDGHIVVHTFKGENNTKRTLKVPFTKECNAEVSPLSALLYAHYLLSRIWIIYTHDDGRPMYDLHSDVVKQVFDQLNYSLQAKFGALRDPFLRQPKASSARLSGYMHENEKIDEDDA